MHVGVGVTVTVPDVVAAPGVDARDSPWEPPAVAAEVALDRLANGISLYCVRVPGGNTANGTGIEDLFVTIVILYLVTSTTEYLRDTACVPPAAASEVARYSLAYCERSEVGGLKADGLDVGLDVAVGEAKHIYAPVGNSPRGCDLSRVVLGREDSTS